MKEFFMKLFNLVPNDEEYSEFKRKAQEYDQLKRYQQQTVRQEKFKALGIGVRVKANQSTGFNRGAEGVVKYVEPNGQRVWVLRDGASSDVYYHPEELDVI